MRMPQDKPPAALTDRTALTRNRSRAAAMTEPAWFLHGHVIDIMQERLEEVNRTFRSPAIVGGVDALVSTAFGSAKHVADTDTLDLDLGSHDLILHLLGLHWANDPVGQLVQARRALAPDGLLLCAAFGGQTLTELRAALTKAEVGVSGGLSPRVAPMGEIRDFGALLQRAGFALPVADSLTLHVEYDSAFHLMRDLRAMGEANSLNARPRHFSRRDMFAEAARIYADAHTQASGRIRATFELVFLTGWAPADTQQKPLPPGSARERLADALGVDETPAGDPTWPDPI